MHVERSDSDILGQSRHAEAKDVDSGKTARLKGAVILVVDDSDMALRFASDALTKVGAKVVTASDVWIAGIVAKHKPILILMDVNIGHTSTGTVAVAALKRRDTTKNIPILLYSSRPKEELAALATECGADGYIEKTGDRKEFVDSVLYQLDKHA